MATKSLWKKDKTRMAVFVEKIHKGGGSYLVICGDGERMYVTTDTGEKLSQSSVAIFKVAIPEDDSHWAVWELVND